MIWEIMNLDIFLILLYIKSEIWIIKHNLDEISRRSRNLNIYFFFFAGLLYIGLSCLSFYLSCFIDLQLNRAMSNYTISIDWNLCFRDIKKQSHIVLAPYLFLLTIQLLFWPNHNQFTRKPIILYQYLFIRPLNWKSSLLIAN